MNRVALTALLFVLNFACSSPAAVIISASAGIDTPGLAGYRTYQVSATSDQYPIVAVDFVGDGSTSGPNAKGFFGAMNQIVLFGGAVQTIFADNNAIIDIQSGVNRLMDSQFAVNSSTVVVPPGLAKETSTSLQAAWAWTEPQGLTVPIAQLVIPIASSGIVTYRGAITVDMNGVYVDIPVSGFPGLVVPLVGDFAYSSKALGEIVELTPFDSAPGSPPIDWSDLSGPTYTPAIGVPSNAPGLGAATWTWDPLTQRFQFRTLGATRGQYVWTGSASNVAGSDEFSLTVEVGIPEPSTLLQAAIVALVGLLSCRPVFGVE